MKNAVKYIRRSADFDLTQEQLAKKVGVSRNTIAAIENGASTSVEIALRISEYFKKEVREVFFYDDVVSSLQDRDSA